MQNKILGWQVTEIKQLLSTIKKEGKGHIAHAFLLHSEQYKRKPTSVRNFYYNFLKLLNSNTTIRANFDDILSDFSTKDARRFDEIAEENLLLEILDYTDRLSVRQKCLLLSNYDRRKFIRYQNKYRNLLKNKPNLVKKCVNLLKKANKTVRNLSFDNVTTFPQNIITMPATGTKILTDADINSLFLGLVNLVKHNVKQTLKQSIKNEMSLVNNALEKSITELRKKDAIISDLTEQNNAIKQKLSATEQKLNQEHEKHQNNLNTISALANSKKMQKLRDFLQKITTFDIISSKKPIN